MNQSQSLERALEILFVLADSETPLPVSEIARRVPIPKSTAYRLIRTLENNGMIERKAKGQISLGLRILDLARRLHQQLDQDLLTTARPVMEKLTDKLNETSLLVVRKGATATTVDYVEGERLIGFVANNGRIHLLHRGASGKAILAFEDDTTIHKIVSELDEVNYDEVLKDLKHIKENGYTMTVAEVDPDTLAIAAPIFDSYDKVCASLTIVGPKGRFTKEIINVTINEVKKSAKEISTKISYIDIERI